MIGTIVAFSFEVIKECFNAALGKKEHEELRYTLTKDLIISCSSLISGGIAAALLPAISGIAFAVGSIIGSITASILTTVGEEVIVSLCVSTGYTLFGIVKQDYKLPTSILKEMGIKINEIERINVEYSKVKRNAISRNSVSYNNVKRTKAVILRRGVIAFHKVGYIQ